MVDDELPYRSFRISGIPVCAAPSWLLPYLDNCDGAVIMRSWCEGFPGCWTDVHKVTLFRNGVGAGEVTIRVPVKD